jgi:uncharacterized protein YndB with AHSA1/START domain
METLKFKIEIKATREKVWQMLWDDKTYALWTKPFAEGCRAISDWKEGSKIHFFGNTDNGIYGQIITSKYPEKITFKHIGNIKDGVEQPLDEATMAWSGAIEDYELNTVGDHTQLSVSFDTVEGYLDFFKDAFPKAHSLLKEICERPTELTVQVQLNAPLEVAWKSFTEPDSITKWCFASDDWHAPNATNDLRTGGNFSTTMAAKDGSFSFDFAGKYTSVIPHKCIEYVMEDGRRVKINFEEKNGAVLVTETFDAEAENSLTLQAQGWQNILDNYKKHTESIVMV